MMNLVAPGQPTSGLEGEEPSAPLFHRVREILQREIRAGAYPVGTALPTEPELCERFQVSRATLRRAVDDLVQDGLVYRRQGSGTYVADPRLNVDLMELRGFQDELRSQGYEPNVVALERRILPAPPDIAARLRLSPGDPIVYLWRLLCSRDEPLGLARGYFPYRLCAALLDADASGPSYEIMEDELGIEISYAEQTIEPRLAGADEARLLGIQRRALLLFLERTTYAVHGDPVHYGRILLRADRYKAAMILRRRRRRPSARLARDPMTRTGER